MLLAKLNWRFKKEKDSLWAKVLSKKYCMRSRTPNHLLKSRTCSTTWAAMKKGADMSIEGSKWIAGTNSNLSFWSDKWLSRGTMRNLIEGPLNQGEDQLLFKDIVGFNGWNWHALSFFISKQLALEIKATPLPFSSTCEDRISWISSTNGDFDIKEAYRIACTEKSVSDHHLFHGAWVWKVLSLPKVQCFLWQCCHQSIPTRALLAARGINIDPLCPLYRLALETIIHLLRDYPFSQISGTVQPPTDPNDFYGSNLMEWLRQNCCSSLRSPLGSIWLEEWKSGRREN